MKGFWKRRGAFEFEAELRAHRQGRPRPEFIDGTVRRIEADALRRRSGLRVAFVGALTVTMLAAFASLGGLGTAAEWVDRAPAKVKKVFVPKAPKVAKGTAARNQYQPQQRVTICHRTGNPKRPYQQITVSRAALPAHLRHGDTVGGTCPPPGRSGVAGVQSQARPSFTG